VLGLWATLEAHELLCVPWPNVFTLPPTHVKSNVLKMIHHGSFGSALEGGMLLAIKGGFCSFVIPLNHLWFLAC
jgi:hypothetical protein